MLKKNIQDNQKIEIKETREFSDLIHNVFKRYKDINNQEKKIIRILKAADIEAKYHKEIFKKLVSSYDFLVDVMQYEKTLISEKRLVACVNKKGEIIVLLRKAMVDKNISPAMIEENRRFNKEIVHMSSYAFSDFVKHNRKKKVRFIERDYPSSDRYYHITFVDMIPDYERKYPVMISIRAIDMKPKFEEFHQLNELMKEENLDLKKQKENLAHEVLYDSLTGAFQSKHWEKMLEECAHDEKRKYCMLMFDLDRFGRVNDFISHDFGDILLSNYGSRVKENIRQNDKFIRYGGEEFFVLFQAPKNKEVNFTKIVNRFEKSTKPIIYKGRIFDEDDKYGLKLIRGLISIKYCKIKNFELKDNPYTDKDIVKDLVNKLKIVFKDPSIGELTQQSIYNLLEEIASEILKIKVQKDNFDKYLWEVAKLLLKYDKYKDLKKAFNGHFTHMQWGDQQVTIENTYSGGVVMVTKERRPKILLTLAESMLKEAKGLGRKKIRFEPGFEEGIE